jgi:hypothetical protein
LFVDGIEDRDAVGAGGREPAACGPFESTTGLVPELAAHPPRIFCRRLKICAKLHIFGQFL